MTRVEDIDEPAPATTPRGMSVGGFEVGECIGRGSHGEVRKGVQKNTGEQVAIKLCKKEAARTLTREKAVYRECSGVEGIPSLRWAGVMDTWQTAGEKSVLVTDLLSASLRDVAERVGGRLPTESVLRLGRKMLKVVRSLHKLSFVHRDIKPENFLLGFGKETRSVFLVDFGLTCKFCDSEGVHASYRQGGEFSGTPNFASLHAHNGETPARRDDIESLLYTLLWLAKGALPWEGLGGRTWQERARRVALRKHVVTAERLGDGLPPQFMDFVKYVRGLGHSEEPDYVFIDGLLASALEHIGADPRCEGSWDPYSPPEQYAPSSTSYEHCTVQVLSRL